MYDAVDQFSSIMNGLGQQQKMASTNIANAHTPNYTRKTYSFTDVLGQLSNPYENKLSRQMGASLENNFTQETGQPVDLTREFVEMQKISLNHSMVSRVVTSIFTNLKRSTQIGK